MLPVEARVYLFHIYARNECHGTLSSAVAMGRSFFMSRVSTIVVKIEGWEKSALSYRALVRYGSSMQELIIKKLQLKGVGIYSLSSIAPAEL